MAEAATVHEAAKARGHRFSVAWRALRRLPLVFVDLLLNLIPVAVFAAIGNALLGTPLGDSDHTRLVVIAVVNAYVLCRVIMCVIRMLVAPHAPRMRLLQCTDETASYVEHWMRLLSGLVVFGFAVAEVGLLFGLYPTAHDVLLKLIGLVVHIMLVIIVLQKRRAVEHRLRARRRATGAMALIQNQLASRWHVIAIFYIVALWLVAAAEIQDGYAKLLHFFIVTSRRDPGVAAGRHRAARRDRPRPARRRQAAAPGPGAAHQPVLPGLARHGHGAAVHGHGDHPAGGMGLQPARLVCRRAIWAGRCCRR